MKEWIYIFVLLCWACAKPVDFDAEKTAITKLIDDETKFAAAADSLNWSGCWNHTKDAVFSIASADGAQQFIGWANIKDGLKGGQPFNLKLKRDNYNFAIGNDIAFVSFDQYDNWGGDGERTTKETRTLKKVGGQWKISNTTVMDFSSYERIKTASMHIAKENIPVGMKAPKTILRSQSGLGGMAVAFNEVPAGTDMTPMFVGLPNDACPAPHWGYILEGSIRVKYVDGKEETVRAGEVFYWPAGHVAIVEKDLKIIDFSPEADFNRVMAHIGKKMAEHKEK